MGRCQAWASGGALACACNPPCREEPECCTCHGVEMGSYAGQEAVETPWGEIAGIDRCILPDVTRLWALGIRTIESCCGHGRASGYIAVRPEHDDRMVALGFARDPRAQHVFAWPATDAGQSPGRDK